MDTNYLAENRLRRLDADLHGRYTQCLGRADALLGRYRSNFPEYTDHTLLHSMNVMNYCNALIGGHIGRLNADELYVLLMAALLHDAGMGLDEAEFERYSPRLPLEAYRREHPGAQLADCIRQFHNDLSAFFIHDHYRELGIPNLEYAKAVGLVGRGHRCVDLMDRKVYPAQMRMPSGRKVHLPYLAAVLRLADEMDISASRNLMLQYAGFVPENDRSAMEFQKHRSIRTAEFEGDRFVINASTDDAQEYEELCQLKKRVQETMDYCRWVALENMRGSFPVNKVQAVIVFTGGDASLTLQAEREAEGLTMRLRGRVDTLTAPLLERKIAESLPASAKVLALDLEAVCYISSAGLRVLLGAKKRMLRQQGDLVLRNVPAKLMEVLRMTGFDNILKIEGS